MIPVYFAFICASIMMCNCCVVTYEVRYWSIIQYEKQKTTLVPFRMFPYCIQSHILYIYV